MHENVWKAGGMQLLRKPSMGAECLAVRRDHNTADRQRPRGSHAQKRVNHHFLEILLNTADGLAQHYTSVISLIIVFNRL